MHKILLTMDKETFDKLVTEFQDLNDKTLKCQQFVRNKEEFEKLDALNRDILIAQLKTMEAYLSVLSIRIGINNKFEEKEEEVSE